MMQGPVTYILSSAGSQRLRGRIYSSFSRNRQHKEARGGDAQELRSEEVPMFWHITGIHLNAVRQHRPDTLFEFPITMEPSQIDQPVSMRPPATAPILLFQTIEELLDLLISHRYLH